MGYGCSAFFIRIDMVHHQSRAFDWRGIELGKVFTFSNSREGFEAFKAWMQHLQDKDRKSHGYREVFTLEEYPYTGKRHYYTKKLFSEETANRMGIPLDFVVSSLNVAK